MTAAFIIGMAAMFWGFAQARKRSPDAVAELTASNNELAQRVRSLEQWRAQDHLTLLRMQTRLEMQYAYSRALADHSGRLADLLRESGHTDVPAAPHPPPETDEQVMPPYVTSERIIAPTLATLFNEDELDDLAMQLGVPDGAINGDTISGRARSLTRYMKRHGRLDALIRQARQLRPDGEFNE